VDVHALARDAARAALEGADGVGARFALEPSGGTIVTDGERLRSVLVNLIANARESLLAAGRSSGEEIEVGARGLGRGGVVLWVADRGPGIPPEDLPHVFEPYFTTKRTGTGLGLAISRKVVEALGGAIRIESREGEGTRVEFELPAEAPAPTEVR
jgi:two-component system sensor histidine kinase HydH